MLGFRCDQNRNQVAPPIAKSPQHFVMNVKLSSTFAFSFFWLLSSNNRPVSKETRDWCECNETTNLSPTPLHHSNLSCLHRHHHSPLFSSCFEVLWQIELRQLRLSLLNDAAAGSRTGRMQEPGPISPRLKTTSVEYEAKACRACRTESSGGCVRTMKR